MKLAIQEGLFPVSDFAEFASLSADWGFDAVEVWGEGLASRVDAVRSALQSARIPACSICPGGTGIRGSLLSSDPDARAAAASDIQSYLELGATLGGAGLVLVPEFGVEKFMRLSPDFSVFEKDKSRFLDAFLPLVKRAEQLGVPIFLEPLNRYEAFFLILLDQAADLCHRINSQQVRVLADLFHMNIEENNVIAALERNASWIGHVHIVDNNRLLPGRGQTSFEPILRALRRSGYQGALCIECGIDGDPRELVPPVVDNLRALIPR